MATRAHFTEKVKEYLDSRNIKYKVVEAPNETVFQFTNSAKGNLSFVTEYIGVRDNRMQCIASVPIKAKPEVYGNVVEYITRINYKLVTGGFDFDYDDGEVRYRDVLWASDEPSADDIELLVIMPIVMIQRYGDGLVKNLMGYGNPVEDIKAAEVAQA